MLGRTYYYKLSDGSYTEIKVVGYTSNKFIVVCLMDNEYFLNIHKDLLLDYREN